MDVLFGELSFNSLQDPRISVLPLKVLWTDVHLVQELLEVPMSAHQGGGRSPQGCMSMSAQGPLIPESLVEGRGPGSLSSWPCVSVECREPG